MTINFSIPKYQREAQYPQCSRIIHVASATAASVGGGLAQFPMPDELPIHGIQRIMIRELAKELNIPEETARQYAVMCSATATGLGRCISKELVKKIPKNVVKKVPVVGNVINAGTAGVITELMGWTIVDSSKKAEKAKAI